MGGKKAKKWWFAIQLCSGPARFRLHFSALDISSAPWLEQLYPLPHFLSLRGGFDASDVNAVIVIELHFVSASAAPRCLQSQTTPLISC